MSELTLYVTRPSLSPAYPPASNYKNGSPNTTESRKRQKYSILASSRNSESSPRVRLNVASATSPLADLRRTAATQRHLSPEDTDLIELTLTTIYELDKLLHLLRDRSENLDLLGVRLTWEEHRTAAWSDLDKLLADTGSFLVTRARWMPSIYEVMSKPEEKPSARRGSVASMASDTSVTTGPGFSRSARFRLAELLSRDAAQIAGKISSLRYGKIAAAGKALDKLIDNSRKPVPEELLDEQDKLEERGINDMEDVGKFVLNVVTQWRK